MQKRSFNNTDAFINFLAIEQSKKYIKVFDEKIVPELNKIKETCRAFVGIFVNNDPAGIISSYEMPEIKNNF